MSIPFTLAEPARVSLSVFDILGRSLVTMQDLDAGAHQARLEGASLPAGTYVLRLSATSGEETLSFVRRQTLLR